MGKFIPNLSPYLHGFLFYKAGTARLLEFFNLHFIQKYIISKCKTGERYPLPKPNSNGMKTAYFLSIKNLGS